MVQFTKTRKDLIEDKEDTKMARTTVRRYGETFDKDAAVRDFQAKMVSDGLATKSNDVEDLLDEITLDDMDYEVVEDASTKKEEPKTFGMSEVEKKEWADRVKGLTDLERVFVLSRFSTNELYNELGKRIHKDDNYISSIRKLVNDYEDLNSTL